MDAVCFNAVLNRESMVDKIAQILDHFAANKANLTFKRGIYVYGAPGSGKTEFVLRLLKARNYDVIKYDAGDVRNKTVIDAITRHNMADKSVVSLFQPQSKPIAIVMDEIDGMNNGDKGGINSLIRLIRPKKTKKQKLEEITYNPIICISSYHVDKKIKELMKVCHVFEMASPQLEQMQLVVNLVVPALEPALVPSVLTYLQGDLRKLTALSKLYQNHCSGLKTEILQQILRPKAYNEDTKAITRKLFNQATPLADHPMLMNETDRTTVGLLWHENVIDALAKEPSKVTVPFYLRVLDNICFADYLDRVTFQKQIWQFNEMSSLIKTCHNSKIYHDTFKKKLPAFNPAEVRFTKVLTKYSTEYNNSLFIQQLCQQLGMDKKDLFAFFLEMRPRLTDLELYALFEPYEISKLDINRIYRYLDKYTNADCKPGSDDVVCDEDDVALLLGGELGDDI